MSQKLLLSAMIAVALVGCTPPELTENRASFGQVAPIVAERCGINACHGDPANGNFKISGGQQGSVAEVRASLEGKETIEGESLVVPGSPAESELYLRLIADPESGELMPPGDPLPAQQIELIRRWIEEGAVYEVQ
ncbi:MAG: hypothetical protein ACQEVA_19375 [Myxococcota bacterium]